MADVAVNLPHPTGGASGPDVPEAPGFGGGGSGPSGSNERVNTARLGLWLALAVMVMLFASFTSAYIVRSSGEDWVPLQVPSMIWLNTVLLLVSSVTVEIARRRFNQWKPIAFRKWMWATAILGSGFLVGQFMAWNQLAAQGIFVSSHPHSSFFYVLTGVHAVHILGGLGALAYVLFLATRYRLTPGDSSSPELSATYWHFVDLVWIYLLVVLFVL